MVENVIDKITVGENFSVNAEKFYILAEDEAKFSTQNICPLRHNFHEHPLMQLDRLEQLAKALAPIDGARFISPGATVSSPFHHQSKSPDGRSVADVFRNIDEPGSWVALYNIQNDPVYREFLWKAMGSFCHLVGKNEKVFDMRGFIFISAPPSVTPFHIDRENNFWLNIRGRKTISLWDWRDREVVAAKDVEDFIAYGSLENVKVTEQKRSRCREFDCGPGEGVYFPSTTPHAVHSDTSWIKPGDGVSISIGVVFYTDMTKRNAYVYAFNTVLRRCGFRPLEPGISKLLDLLKYPVGRTIVALRKTLRGYSPPPGF
jgi:hypothetical protein